VLYARHSAVPNVQIKEKERNDKKIRLHCKKIGGVIWYRFDTTRKINSFAMGKIKQTTSLTIFSIFRQIFFPSKK
jgi:ribosomal protein S1